MTTLHLSQSPHYPPPNDRSGDAWPTKTRRDAERYVLAAAGVVIVALTAGAFWLSYAHLADVAGQHGLGSSPIRRWAWPATLDAFIVAGELLMLRAALRRVTDRWAIGVTVIGSAGSIALNVAGVSGTGSTVPFLDYVVAAVPPSAAMVAFGVLMRQIHELVERPGGGPGAGSVRVPEPPVTASVQPTPGGRLAEASAGSSRPDNELRAERGQPVAPPAAVSVHSSSEPPNEDATSTSRGGRPPTATIEELADIGRAAAHQHGKLTRGLLRNAVKEKDLTLGSERQTAVMDRLRPELEAAGIEVSRR